MLFNKKPNNLPSTLSNLDRGVIGFFILKLIVFTSSNNVILLIFNFIFKSFLSIKLRVSKYTSFINTSTKSGLFF